MFPPVLLAKHEEEDSVVVLMPVAVQDIYLDRLVRQQENVSLECHSSHQRTSPVQSEENREPEPKWYQYRCSYTCLPLGLSVCLLGGQMVCCGCCLCVAFFCEMAIRSVIISPLSKWDCRHRYTPGLFQCVEHMDTNGVRREGKER